MKNLSLALSLFQYLSMKEPMRFSHGEYLHVTDLYTACFRQIFYARTTKTTIEKYIPANLRMAFEMGRIVEERVKSWLMNMGILSTDPGLLRDESLKIEGTLDGRLRNGMLLEIKGMDPLIFRYAMKKPLPRHMFQVEAYLWLDQKEKEQGGKLLLVTWGTKEKVPFYDRDIYYNYRTEEVIKQSVSQLREAEAGGALPGRICRDKNDANAIICPFRDRCFSEEGKITQTIAEILSR